MAMVQTVLLADADVLIDYRESELDILKLVVKHIGRVVVLAPILDEVRGVTPTQCRQLGIEVVEATTEQLVEASEGESRVSFNDCLCLVACRDGAGHVLRTTVRSNASANATA